MTKEKFYSDVKTMIIVGASMITGILILSILGLKTNKLIPYKYVRDFFYICKNEKYNYGKKLCNHRRISIG